MNQRNQENEIWIKMKMKNMCFTALHSSISIGISSDSSSNSSSINISSSTINTEIKPKDANSKYRV